MGSVAESFHPADPEPVKRDVKSGLIALMPQSICAIELMGIEFFRAQTEVKTLRTIRDTMLATTDEGRAWVTLFERIQAPVMASLLADRDLRSGAASLVRRAAQQTRKDAGPLTDDDVDGASASSVPWRSEPTRPRCDETSRRSSGASRPCAVSPRRRRWRS